ncbi:MAG: FAD-binding oxidoreductase [Candidatus Accumulibacter phosphatis]|uniref:FAD-binding oxidoreductase n=1 Tax=Candidatus Thiothrix phosphatis TaxID=3112415 RepID=A0ABU6CV78_9GAMM|nr:FAD-binding oxidoreductase [Candidatus Thiothrix sp. Deng01]MCQ1549066.1 FAD-binding oxidoreductase [Candidatus Accumulibacter phosphatis]MEB4590740.1 FAD-binding oxidoreductase [Candidatus Thiothrix sp. Deng01]
MEIRAGTPPLGEEIADQLRVVVGADYVCTSVEDLDRYSRCTIPWQSRCMAVVFPASADEVAGIVRIAARHRLAVWPSSTGRNWGYGTTLAIEDGAIVMILERMNRVLEVNEELAYAVIEPGVTYEQFNKHLRSKGYKLWIDCTDGSGQGSVIGNAIERGIGETPYGDHFGNLCGIEVVLPDGERVHVGGAIQGLKTWHTHKWGLGPYLEGIFTQSSLGIVTKAGIWLMPQPESYNSFVYEIHDERHLPKVLDIFRRLALTGVVNTKLHMINDFVSMTILTQRIAEQVPQDGPLSDAHLAALRRKYGIAPWNCAGGIYGTRGQVKLQRSLLRQHLSPHGRLIFLSDRLLPYLQRVIDWSWKSPLIRRLTELAARTSLPVLDSAPYVHKILQGIPTEYFVKHAYYRYRRPRPEQVVQPARDRCGLIWFAPILPFSNEQVWPFLDACKQRFAAHGFDFYVAMLLMNPRSVVCLMAIIFDHEDTDETARSQQLYQELLAIMHERQFQQYRAGLQSWGDLFRNAPEMQRLHAKIKAALDPDNILAPGHYGVSCRQPIVIDNGNPR